MADNSLSGDQKNELSRNEKFMVEINSIIESNLGNEKFGVNDIAGIMAMSRVQLYRKLHNLTAKNVSQYIREFRLQRAMELLEKDVATVSEIAYRVGFSSPGYFNKCFNAYFGYPPGQVKKNLIKNEILPGNSKIEQDVYIGKDRNIPFTKKRIIRVFLLAAGIIILVAVGINVLPQMISGKSSGNAFINNTDTEKTVAVLPFETITSDSASQYIADGVREAILNDLIKINGLKVGSKASADRYRGSKMKISDIANELNVASVMTGSAQKFGNKIRITVQLINAKTDRNIWSEEYDKNWKNVFDLYSLIAKEVASSLQLVISPEEKNRISKLPTDNIHAYELYIKAKYVTNNYWNSFSSNQLRIAQELLNEALLLDSSFTDAIALKGSVFNYEGKYDSAFVYANRLIALDPENNRGYGLMGQYYTRKALSDSAITYFSKAIRFPPEDNEWIWYHTELGNVHLYQKNDIITALRYYRKSLNLSNDPSFSPYIGLANCYKSIGDYKRAEAYIKEALDRHQRPFCIFIDAYTNILQVQGRFREALHFLDSIGIDGECNRVDYKERFWAYLYLGEYKQAVNYYNKWDDIGFKCNSTGIQVESEIGLVYSQLGEPPGDSDVFADIIKVNLSRIREGYDFSKFYILDLARIYAFKGKKDLALKYLKASIKNGFFLGWHDLILLDPFFKSLRNDPDFLAIVKKGQNDITALRERIHKMEARGELEM